MVDQTYSSQVVDATPSTVEKNLRIRLIFCLALAAVKAVILLYSARGLLQDPDNWWHVRVGLDMLTSHTFPTVDTYSYTFAGNPWIAKEWLGQILFALAYKAGDWNGVVLLAIAAIASATFLLAWYLSAWLKPTVAIGLTFLLIFLVDPIYTARPVVFTLPIIIIWTAELFEAARRERAPSFWLLPLIVLWANLHGTFTFGFVIAAFAGLDFLVRTRFAKPGLLGRWIAFGLLCPVVTLLNPYGIKAILATFSVASGNEAVSFITEWQAFNASEAILLEGVLLAALFGILVARPKIGWVKILFLLFNLHLFLTHQRFAYMLILLVPLVIAPEIGAQFAWISARKWAEAPRDWLEKLAACYFRPLSAAIGIVLVVGAIVFSLVGKIEPSPKTSAKGALAYAEEHGVTGNVFNSYDFGGTLIFHGIKTFIDGRTDQLFLNGFMKKSMLAGSSAGKPVLEELLKDHAVKWALLKADDQRIPFFDELPDWQRVYADADAVIYVSKQ
ncbi:hypothetical protein HB779_24915 (plasmid) [Phyllobacterium sp. 628]|uniref:hypothetical protein n=1 Tax=Phyllobacterium sp. 628 TaxID=2718938 RepID=UPI0016624F82|nr:hypothetical protein [Phyllobacterium sp. 628]QND55099.1 hypothetical protein HB779_24915 [Phyllobacterium sp. 628]